MILGFQEKLDRETTVGETAYRRAATLATQAPNSLLAKYQRKKIVAIPKRAHNHGGPCGGIIGEPQGRSHQVVINGPQVHIPDRSARADQYGVEVHKKSSDYQGVPSLVCQENHIFINSAKPKDSPD